MNLANIIKASNAFTDETVSEDFALRYANEAIATLNTTFGLNLPFFTDGATDFTAISDSWQYRLICNWVSYGVKMNDSSLQEAMEYKQKFYEALTEFGGVYLRTDSEGNYIDIDGQYIVDNSGSVYQMDTSNAIDMGWFGRLR